MFVKRSKPKQIIKKKEDNDNQGIDGHYSEENSFHIDLETKDGPRKHRVKGANALFCTSSKDKKESDASTEIKAVFETNYIITEDRHQRATPLNECDTEESHDHRAILERNEKIGKALLTGELEDGVYRGMGALRPLINTREGAISAGKHSGWYGPVRGNRHVRMTMRIDLNPEICKDYKETGYCGFGDTCIFLHDRSDYKSGYQLENEWQAQQRQLQEKEQRKLRRLQAKCRNESNTNHDQDANECCTSTDDEHDSDSDDNEGIPKACMICHKQWEVSMNPVTTL